LDKKTGDAKR
jgi:hypothetical protein